jgi:uncharacterized protein
VPAPGVLRFALLRGKQVPLLNEESPMQLTYVADRPWPIPRQPWILRMHWHDLLFMHWPIASDAIRPYIPPALTIDTFEGSAWIGIVPFRMSGVAPRLIPPLPFLSAFPELNVRTYVIGEGRPGVWFFSLDAANPVAVEAARDLFHLNYYNARMRCSSQAGTLHYRSDRIHRGAPAAALIMSYRPTGAVYYSDAGALDNWLTERYCLYAANRRGSVWRGEIDHAKWSLQPAEAEIVRNTMTEQIKVMLPDTKPLLHFARHQNVVAWPPRRLRI